MRARVVPGEREVVRQDRRPGVELPTRVALEPQSDRHVQLAPQLERQARVGDLLDRRTLETDVAVGLAREHA